MPSVDSIEIVKDLVKGDGSYYDDPKAILIAEYTNNWEGKTYFISYCENDTRRLFSSPFCRNIIILWTSAGLTPEGLRLFAEPNPSRGEHASS